MGREAGYIKRARDLDVYRRAYAVSLDVHKATLVFPKMEQYALADQMRRSSKAICANLAEGFAKTDPFQARVCTVHFYGHGIMQ
ncbi:four helix bundle protein [Mesorhizobium sp. CA13]|uniref:four helix bundle protein n=1 Tax=Mesorhizobium sp. CA13 TaxID=2876643 RepID=UPI0021E1DEB4|nr:four helix bundle protein [Mesorhizobium sp. CA13]